MASIRDVAKRAGVSITTVSRTLNNYNDVSVSTKERILKICKEMNYLPNPMAHNLKAKRAKNIALILSENKKTDANGNIIYRLLLGIQETCNERGYDFCVVFTDRNKQMQKSLHEICTERSLGGAVIYGLKVTDPYYEQIDDAQIPIASIDFHSGEIESIFVGTDNDSAIDEIVNAFVSKGKTRVAMVNGGREAEISMLRERCYLNACAKYGLHVRGKYIRYADFTKDRSYEETKELLQLYPDIDGILYASDLMAIGGMNALLERNIRIPEQIAISGFDGIEAGSLINPAITTVLQDFEGKGKVAAERVIDVIENKECSMVNYVSYRFIRRDTL